MKFLNILASIFFVMAYGDLYAQPNDSTMVVKTTTTEKELSVAAKTGNIRLEENFNQVNRLPVGWMIPRDNAGKVFVKAGHLYIDGRAHNNQTTSVMLPELLKQQNYRIDVEFSFENENNSARWGSIIYQAGKTSAHPAYYPYYQFAIRSDATVANGTEFARKNIDHRWDVKNKAPFTEKIDAHKMYKATIMLYGNRVQHYLNDVLVQDTELSADQWQGGIGLSAAGLVMKVNHVKVSTLSNPVAELVRSAVVQESGTVASMAPTIIQIMNHNLALNQVSASQVYFSLDAQLNMIDTTGNKTSLKTYLSDSQRRTIAVLKIKDQATIVALKQLAQSRDLTDVAVISEDINLLYAARTQVPTLRSILDLRAQKKLSATDLLNIANQSNQALAKIVVLPKHLLNRANVSYLQRLLMTVWAESAGQTAQEAATILVTGVNGIITENATMFNGVLKKLPAHTLLRKPLVVGHRGVPSLEDENTLEGLRRAVSLGADAIENDIYITKDNHLVIMHDATVDRTTQAKGKIEDMTLAELRKLRTKAKGYAVPTLAEYFTELKQHKNVMHFIELKSANEKIVDALKAQIQQYQVADQVVTISFHPQQIQRMKVVLPTVSTGYLSGAVPASGDLQRDISKILLDTQKYSSSYHPQHSPITPPLMESLKHRGLTIWPWSVNDEKRFNALYVAGTHGITTDYSQFASKFVTEITTANRIRIQTGQTLSVAANLSPKVGNVYAATANRYVVLSDSPAYQTHSDGTVTFSEKGQAYVLPGYQYQIDKNYAYNIFAAPVKVIVQ